MDKSDLIVYEDKSNKIDENVHDILDNPDSEIAAEIDENILNIDNLPMTIISDKNEILYESDINIQSTSGCTTSINNKEAIKEILSWPIQPQRKGTKFSPKKHFVLTSDNYQQMMEEKRQKQLEEENLKEERKRKNPKKKIRTKKVLKKRRK